MLLFVELENVLQKLHLGSLNFEVRPKKTFMSFSIIWSDLVQVTPNYLSDQKELAQKFGQKIH